MTSFKQKLSALLVLSLFIVSVLPAGLADEGKEILDVNVEAKADVDSDTADAEVKAESKTEVETEDNDSETKEGAKGKTKLKEGHLLNAKRAQKEIKELRKDFHDAREKLEEAKEHYQKAKEEQHQQREKVLDLNKKVKQCNSEKRDCEALKIELRTGVKNHLLKSVQVVERSLEKLTKTIEKMEDLSDEEKESALSLVADLQSQLEAQKAKIDSFTPETSQEEIRAAIKDLKELNQEAHKLQRRLVGLLVNEKLNVLVEKQAELHNAMQARIDALAATDADVSELEKILADFDAKVKVLTQDYETAQQKWMEAKDATDFDLFNRNLREAQHQVREDLQETKQLLRKFVAKYHELTSDSNEEKESPESSNESQQETGEHESGTANDSDHEEAEGSNTTDETNASVEVNASAEATA